MSFYEKLSPANVAPLWRAKGLLSKEPDTPAVPFLWPYAEVRELLLEAGGVVTAEEAERRVLMLMNPGLEGRPAATANLYAGLQLVLPGEIAPMHRHSAAALRLICEGSGAYTAVDGEKATMEVGDLVLTPSWTWHDHGNETEEPMIWLDGLDLPLLHKLETHFFEVTSESRQELTVPDDSGARLYASARLNPAWIVSETPYSPMLSYPWKQVERQLEEAASVSDGSPTDGLLFEYVNPFTGGPVMPTLSCQMQLLKAGMHTDAHQHTSAAVYHVVRGEGASIIGGERFEWTQGDTFALPAWAVHEHLNGSAGDDAVLFSFSDEPVVRSLGLYREQSAERQG